MIVPEWDVPAHRLRWLDQVNADPNLTSLEGRDAL